MFGKFPELEIVTIKEKIYNDIIQKMIDGEIYVENIERSKPYFKLNNSDKMVSAYNKKKVYVSGISEDLETELKSL